MSLRYLLFAILALPVLGFANESCNAPSTPADEIRSSSVADLIEVSGGEEEAVAEQRQVLLSPNLTLGSTRLAIGGGTVSIGTRNGEITDLTLIAEIRFLGTKTVTETVTLEEFMSGKPLIFAIKKDGVPVSENIIIIEPGRDINANGGSAGLKFWNGEGHEYKNVFIVREGGSFVMYINSVGAGNRITGLTVNIGGMSLSKVHIRDYSIETR